MSAIMNALGIDRWTVEERLKLMNEIWDSVLASGERIGLNDDQRAELRRREEEADADPEGEIPLEEARRRIASRIAS